MEWVKDVLFLLPDLPLSSFSLVFCFYCYALCAYSTPLSYRSNYHQKVSQWICNAHYHNACCVREHGNGAYTIATLWFRRTWLQKVSSHLSTRYRTHNGHLLPLDRNAINCLWGLEFLLTCTIVHADHRSDTVSGQGHDVNFARVSFRTSFKAMMALLDH